ncbi:MAG: hypothetical protein Q4G42_03425 [Neisseria sp.]|nr:hypothetical protein [Neisseria sp.]
MIVIGIALGLIFILFLWWLIICLFGWIGAAYGANGRKIGRAVPFWLGIAFLAYHVGMNITAYGAYRYYCKYEAGTKFYKTLEQWKAENPGVWETLKKVSWDNRGSQYLPNDYKNNPDIKEYIDIEGKIYRLTSGGNQRILEYNFTDYPFKGYLERYHHIAYDNKKNNVLAIRKRYLYNTLGSLVGYGGQRRRSIFGTYVCNPENKDLNRNYFSKFINSFSNHKLNEKE